MLSSAIMCFIKQSFDRLDLDIAALSSFQQVLAYAMLCVIRKSIHYLIFLFAALGQIFSVPSENLQ